MDPEITYDQIDLIDLTANIASWSIPGILTGDQAIGIVVALYFILNAFDGQFRIEVARFPRPSILIDTHEENLNTPRNVEQNIDNYDEQLQRTIPYNLAMADMIANDKYTVWIRTLHPGQDIEDSDEDEPDEEINDLVYHYIRINFRTVEFLQGFISICQAFGVNYNDLIIFPILRVENRIINQKNMFYFK